MDHQNICSFCQDPEDTSPLRRYCQCNSLYHEQCLQKWIKNNTGRNNRCELCHKRYDSRKYKSNSNTNKSGSMGKNIENQAKYCCIIS